MVENRGSTAQAPLAPRFRPVAEVDCNCRPICATRSVVSTRVSLPDIIKLLPCVCSVSRQFVVTCNDIDTATVFTVKCAIIPASCYRKITAIVMLFSYKFSVTNELEYSK